MHSRLLKLLASLPLVTAVWPLPSSAFYGNTTLFIDQNVRVTWSLDSQVSAVKQTCLGSCHHDAHSQNAQAASEMPEVISTAIASLQKSVFNQTYYPWQFHPRNANSDPPANEAYPVITKIVLHQTGPVGSLKPAQDLDESYELLVGSDTSVTISAASSIGLAYGLTTFSQLFYQTRDGKVYTSLAPAYISDKPKFSHRGLNLDVARSYYPPATILRQIDALASVKMNRLHLHITDSQSWPLEIPSLPLLAEKGRYAPGLTYSPDAVRDIQAYGVNRGVEVYLEIDMPGHIGIIELAYPNLTTAWNVQPDWDTYSLEPPSGAIKLNSAEVDAFLDTMFDDILPRVSDHSKLWHTGGDEVVTEQYTLEPGINSNDSTVLKPYMQRLFDRNFAKVASNGLTPIIWEELLLEWNLTLPDNALVQCWKSPDSILMAVQSGHRVIAGDYKNWYLDCGHGQWLDAFPDSAISYPYQDYCSPRKSWRQIYAFDPLAFIPDDLTHLVVGGEVHMWSEQTDAVDVDGKIWPRAAAAAEVLWSGAKDDQGRNRSQVEASPRLADLRERLVRLGIRAESVHMPFCTQNGTQCAL